MLDSPGLHHGLTRTPFLDSPASHQLHQLQLSKSQLITNTKKRQMKHLTRAAPARRRLKESRQNPFCAFFIYQFHFHSTQPTGSSSSDRHPNQSGCQALAQQASLWGVTGSCPSRQGLRKGNLNLPQTLFAPSKPPFFCTTPSIFQGKAQTSLTTSTTPHSQRQVSLMVSGRV